MRKISPQDFTGNRAWEALDIERFEGPVTVQLHWTDQPYRWHVNDGPEVFVVLEGAVEMRGRRAGKEVRYRLGFGDLFHAAVGGEHVAYPLGVARVLVIESEGSV